MMENLTLDAQLRAKTIVESLAPLLPDIWIGTMPGGANDPQALCDERLITVCGLAVIEA